MHLVNVLEQLVIMHDDIRKRIGSNAYALESITKREKKFGYLSSTDAMLRDSAIKHDKAMRDKLTALDYLMGRIVGELLQ